MIKIAFLSVMGIAASASAIVVDDYDAAEAAPAGLDWSHVHNYKGSSGVAVGGHWMLTAAHVADDGGSGALSIGGTIYNQQEIIFHPTVDGRTPDLALVRYDKVLPGYYSLYTGSLPNLSVLMVGYGSIGVAYTGYWTDDGIGRGAKRWGSQKIDRTYIKTVDAGGTVGLTKTAGLEMDFDLGDTSHEAGTGSGDSGGGVFFYENGMWKLAGINTSRSESGGGYGSAFAAAMPWYRDWVAETIPEPAAISLMGLSTVGLFLARTKRRRKLLGANLFPIGREPMCDTFRTLEEPEAHGRIWKGTDFLTGLKQAIQSRPLAAWSNVHIWCKGLNKVFWNHMVVAHERRLDRKKAFKFALKKKAMNGLDAFLALVMK